MPKNDYSADGRYVIANGRRWRATDPGIPESLRGELVGVLMHARRQLARLDPTTTPSQSELLRSRVHDAKLALGERGPDWWDDQDRETQLERARAATRTLHSARPGRDLSARDVALVIAGRFWRRSVAIALEAIAHEALTGGTTGADVAGQRRSPTGRSRPVTIPIGSHKHDRRIVATSRPRVGARTPALNQD